VLAYTTQDVELSAQLVAEGCREAELGSRPDAVEHLVVLEAALGQAVGVYAPVTTGGLAAEGAAVGCSAGVQFAGVLLVQDGQIVVQLCHDRISFQMIEPQALCCLVFCCDAIIPVLPERR